MCCIALVSSGDGASIELALTLGCAAAKAASSDAPLLIR